jgi:undecaprenyl-diphosphatase
MSTSADERIFRLLNGDGGWVLDWLAVVASERSFGIAIGVLVCVWLVWKLRARSGRALAALALTLVLSDAVGSQVVRPLFGHVRPCYALPPGTIRWLAPAANVGSLPSLHAANLFALALVGALAHRRLALPLYMIAVAVGLSRIYVGVHWPSDVLAGAVWGTLCAALGTGASRLARRAERPA